MPRAAAARGRKPLHSPNRIQPRTSPQRNSDSTAHTRQGHAQPLLSHCRTAVTLAALPMAAKCPSAARRRTASAINAVQSAPQRRMCSHVPTAAALQEDSGGLGGGVAPDRCMAGTTRSRAAPAGARRTCASHLCQSAGAIRPPAECGAPIVPNCTTLTVGRMHARRAECGVQCVLTACTCVLC
jgi:hypothetical protein